MNKSIWRKRKRKQKKKLDEAKKQAATKNLFEKKKKIHVPKEIISSNEEDEEMSLHDSNDDETDWIPEPQPSAFEELDKDPEPGDFVLVQFEAKNNVFYVGKVVNLQKLTNDIEVNFLRKSAKIGDHFVFPHEPDVSTVPLEDVKLILPPPVLLGRTKRLQEYHRFEINFSNLNMR
jgi:hypothetical protein